MRKVKAIVVEDELIVRRDIEAILTQHGHTVVASCATGEEAASACATLRPDVVLMDIVLKGGISGIDAAMRIRQETGAPVIFLTANTDPATVNKARVAMPYGFIPKPFKPVDVLTAIEMGVHNHEKDMQLLRERDELRGTIGHRTEPASMFVNIKGRTQGIRFAEVHYVEALKDYVGIHLHDRRIVVHATLAEIERSLPQSAFLRVHRSYIVRVDRIKAIEGMDIIMEKNEQVIPIGGHHLANLRARLGLDA